MILHLLLITMIPALIGIFLSPFAILWAAKRMQISNPKLTYWRQFANCFVASFVGNVLAAVVPFGAIIGFLLMLALLLSGELKITWNRALLLSLAPLVVGVAASMLFTLVVLSTVLSPMPVTAGY